MSIFHISFRLYVLITAKQRKTRKKYYFCSFAAKPRKTCKKYFDYLVARPHKQARNPSFIHRTISMEKIILFSCRSPVTRKIIKQ